MSNIQKVALVIALVALPGAAHAGTSTATGTAVLNVVNQSSVTGATVDFGTYTSNHTVADAAADTGQYAEDFVYRGGGRGLEYAAWGSVTCDAGIPYALSIKGTTSNPWAPNAIQFQWLNTAGIEQKMMLDLFAKKIGGNLVPDSDATFQGAGALVTRTTAAGVGTGVPQAVVGSAVYNWGGSWGDSTEKLLPGTYTDTLTYTLDF